MEATSKEEEEMWRWHDRWVQLGVNLLELLMEAVLLEWSSMGRQLV
jgi:hypothetical protein